jgi:ribonuclease R
VNIGHFGLASTDYLHFTSPIRRYPDLVVHRLLKNRLAAMNRPAGGFKPGATTTDRLPLQKMAADSSFAERQAMEVEREVIDLYRAFFLRDRIGDVFDGIISGVTGFGVFVTVDDPFVEGLVRIDALSDDYYNYDESGARLVGRRSGKAFALGDSVRVEVQSVSVVRRKIDFALADHVPRHRAVREGARGERGKRGRDRAKPAAAGSRGRPGRKDAGPERSNRGRGSPKRKGRR